MAHPVPLSSTHPCVYEGKTNQSGAGVCVIRILCCFSDQWISNDGEFSCDADAEEFYSLEN